MTTKRRTVLLLLAAVALAVVLTVVPRSSIEPEYHGRRLSDWLEQYNQNPYGSRESLDAQDAVRAIGANALPYLLKWFSYETPSWRRTLHNKLPDSINGWLFFDADRLACYAGQGIGILGTNATSTIPDLEACMKDSTRPGCSSRAIVTLASLGEPAIPVLQAGLADTNVNDPSFIILVFSLMAKGGQTNLCLPILVQALDHNDLSVRSAATNALQEISPEVLTNATAR